MEKQPFAMLAFKGVESLPTIDPVLHKKDVFWDRITWDQAIWFHLLLNESLRFAWDGWKTTHAYSPILIVTSKYLIYHGLPWLKKFLDANKCKFWWKLESFHDFTIQVVKWSTLMKMKRIANSPTHLQIHVEAPTHLLEASVFIKWNIWVPYICTAMYQVYV